MDNRIDNRFITDGFLLKYFPSPNRYHEATSNPPINTLIVSKERYLEFREKVNQERTRAENLLFQILILK